MKRTVKIILAGIVVIYLLIGIGIEIYYEFKASQNESLLEGLLGGVARDNERLAPWNLIKIIFWPLYL